MIPEKCSFCGTKIGKGHGTLFVKNDGTMFLFCSKKCEKNQIKLRRIPKNVQWTEAGRKQRGKK